jgi:hypothetical protein
MVTATVLVFSVTAEDFILTLDTILELALAPIKLKLSDTLAPVTDTDRAELKEDANEDDALIVNAVKSPAVERAKNAAP